MLKQEKQWPWQRSCECSSPLPQGKGAVNISENRISWPLTTKKIRERSCPKKIQLTFSLSWFRCWVVFDSLRPHGLQHTPGFPALHHVSEFAQTLVCWVGDAIQPSHPLSSPSLPPFSFSHDEQLFHWLWRAGKKKKDGKKNETELLLFTMSALKGCCWITRIHRDSWPPEEKNSIRGQRRGGEEFNPGPETRLDRSELLCNKVLLKYKGDRERFWYRHQKGVERVPAC